MAIKRILISLLTGIGALGLALTLILLVVGGIVILRNWFFAINSTAFNLSSISFLSLGLFLLVLALSIILTKFLFRGRKKFVPIRFKQNANDDNRHANQKTAYGIFYVLMTIFITTSLYLLTAFPDSYPPLIIAISVSITVTSSNIISNLLGLSISTSRYEPVALCFEKPDSQRYKKMLGNIALSFFLPLVFFSLYYLI